ncbi:oleate hydratase [Clostridium botulinum]|uniref:Monoamine oxidase family protein, membrane associated n=1 Tax=Clostridium botulinum (strain Eklund 17B / Type B) TaxID=935198 RepID=B2TM67_CLOBB|nr:oleate hydratase [Clostridium sp. ZBS4]ACD23986.1 monoamine oxidase family protein, membrane associated [Clostridium botulinum B str. Eklund 17B (NRP)]MBY6977054.1 oleate hydratase [Clostridium botulinum]MBY6999212.1 oleate hydratase [Clostridium botulinum]MCR1272707.1 oleate hydratase [Clostridium botulinum]NFD69924.1 oleate hydratase [Clostridium botulinum]
MGNYQRNNTIPPQNIKRQKAYLVGGGIASLAAAFYLIRDGHIDGKNITIFEELNIEGGAMDGAGNAETGYIIRGGREMEEHYECTWDLFADIPSLENYGYSVLDEFKELNDNDPNISKCRLIHNCGQKKNSDSMELSPAHAKRLTELFLATEDALGNTTVEQFFDESFLDTNFWYLWRSMFAFENWHGVVEMKRYMHRFIHLLPGFNKMKGLVFPKYNQYDSFILPLSKHLESKGVKFQYGTQVIDLDIDIKDKEKTVTGIHIIHDNKEQVINIRSTDIVMVTNGSMTECSEYADNKTVPKLRKDLGGVWSLWKNISEKDPAFGHPEVFCGDVDRSKWESFTITCKDSKLVDKIRELSGNEPHSGKTVTGGIITMTDSNWLLSVTCNRQPHFPDQPDDVIVLWAYGLLLDNEGNYIKKKMTECTGEELLKELLYHLGLEKDIPEILKTDKVIPAMMPYITAQFMPRVKGDRPNVVPEGSKNLAFLGQFAEVPGDCVFTVEYSIRSAIMATYKLLNLNKKVPEVHPSQYDIRVIANAVKTLNSGRPLPAETIIKKLLKDTSMEGLI